MKVLRIMFTTVVLSVLVSGCFYAHVVTPLDRNVDKTNLGQKTGKALSYSLLWAAAWGDAGTAAAAKNGGITTVNHMDMEIFSVFFGIYTETTTIVYGD
jgi:hypothetical protein